MLNYRARYTGAAPSAYMPLKHIAITVHILHTHARTSSSPRNPNPRRYSNYYGVSAFPWRSARTFEHAKLPVCSRNVVTSADVHFHYRLIKLIFSTRVESTCSCAVFPWCFPTFGNTMTHLVNTNIWHGNGISAICGICISCNTRAYLAPNTGEQSSRRIDYFF